MYIPVTEIEPVFGTGTISLAVLDTLAASGPLVSLSTAQANLSHFVQLFSGQDAQ